MRLLVTGGAGFIGSNFVRKSLDGTFLGISSVTVLDKFTYAGNRANLESVLDKKSLTLVKGDICDFALVQSLLNENDVVVNFAAESHVDRSIESSKEFIRTNVVGVQVLLDALKQEGKIKRLLQVSTDEVYGSISFGSWKEESSLLPNSPYAASKAGGEFLARSYFQTHSLDVVITRSSNNYGPFHFPEKLIPLFITNLIEGKKIPIYGNGMNVRDWLHVDDHCQGIYKVLIGGRSGQIYNIGGGAELNNLQLTNMILKMMGAEESSIEFVKDRKAHDLRYSLDWSKIKNELEYQPVINIEEGLRSTIDWYMANTSWWKPLKNMS